MEQNLSNQYYIGWFAVLLAALFVFKQMAEKYWVKGESTSTKQSTPVNYTPEFKVFQKTYLLVYLLMMAGDWLQGPYVYALYKHYGFDKQDIGMLFLAGFGASMLFGLVVGSMADKYGRRTSCLLFGVLYSLSCMTKHSGEYRVLMFGRVLGGISTSILFSSFESWLVHEHHSGMYPSEWLGDTFSLATSGNGLVAIASGVVASQAAEAYGPVAPFDVAMVCLVLGSLIVFARWNENYGEQRFELSTTVSNAWERLIEDQKIWLLGVIQSFFEGAMYIFVFMWTTALEGTTDRPIPHGWIFASFMICVLIGSTLFGTLLRVGERVERFSVYTFAVAAVSLFVPAIMPVHSVRLVSFFVFEVCCGMFWPSLGMMRSKYVPEEVRATVMNFFRIPLNMIVVVVLFHIGDLSELQVFSVCVACLSIALVCQLQLLRITADSPEMSKKDSLDEEDTHLDDAVPLESVQAGSGH